MPRAKYNNDPRVCPFCNQKRLYHGTAMLGDDTHYASIDMCRNPKCGIDSFRGKAVRYPGKRPGPDEMRARVEAIRAEAQRAQLMVDKYQRDVKELNELADRMTATLES